MIEGRGGDDTFRHGLVLHCECRVIRPARQTQMHEIETRCCDVNAPQTLLPPRGAEKYVCEFSVDKKNQLDVTFSILYFSSNSCSTCFGQPCAHHQELTTAS